MNKFWKWKSARDSTTGEEVRTLYITGVIADESWYTDDVTPLLFKKELKEGRGDITLWINSPGGDTIAAAEIYNALMEYPWRVTVKIDALAASAASVIAMAGERVLMSRVGMMMIHNPFTVVQGDTEEMKKAIGMLESVKESIINAYEIKTGLPRNKLSSLMDDETWMDSRKAKELGFIDGFIETGESEEEEGEKGSLLFSEKRTNAVLLNSVKDRIPKGREVEPLIKGLEKLLSENKYSQEEEK